MDREAWRTAVHGVAKSQTWLCDWTELKSTIQWHQVHSQYDTTITTIRLQSFFIFPNRNSLNINSHSFPPAPGNTTLLSGSMNVASLGISWKGDHKCLSFFVSLFFLLSIMSSGFIHVVVCVRTSFFFKAELYSIVCIYYIFVYPFIHRWTLGLLPPFGYCE